jgi:hypothetical protein
LGVDAIDYQHVAPEAIKKFEVIRDRREVDIPRLIRLKLIRPAVNLGLASNISLGVAQLRNIYPAI